MKKILIALILSCSTLFAEIPIDIKDGTQGEFLMKDIKPLASFLDKSPDYKLEKVKFPRFEILILGLKPSDDIGNITVLYSVRLNSLMKYPLVIYTTCYRFQGKLPNAVIDDIQKDLNIVVEEIKKEGIEVKQLGDF